jgi:hypothetical protein
MVIHESPRVGDRFRGIGNRHESSLGQPSISAASATNRVFPSLTFFTAVALPPRSTANAIQGF